MGSSVVEVGLGALEWPARGPRPWVFIYYWRVNGPVDRNSEDCPMARVEYHAPPSRDRSDAYLDRLSSPYTPRIPGSRSDLARRSRCLEAGWARRPERGTGE